jgi:hypothetical protein
MISVLDVCAYTAIIFSPLIVTNSIVINLLPFGPQPQVFQRAGAFVPFPIGAVQPTTGVTGGSVGTGDVPRNINIHIHAGKSIFCLCALESCYCRHVIKPGLWLTK